ncbi:hypothetical protein SDC9_161280 [bioreactor metagenome]|uniref:Uncharacterized protein n=1 Tax=bioreactor metagenome TaxID=1076179 RepID=A0A645FNZ1_9ZZZZ
MPEGIQSSERGEISQVAIENMGSAISSIEEAIDLILSAAE